MNTIRYSPGKVSYNMGFGTKKAGKTRQRLEEIYAFISEHPEHPKAIEIKEKWQKAIDLHIRKKLHKWLNSPEGQEYLDKHGCKDRTCFKREV